MSPSAATHCINPDCSAPYPQPGHHKFCQRCGTALHLQQRYIPLQKLGSGGFSAIYTIWDLETRQEKVLKVLTTSSEKAEQLFVQEAIVLRSLHHPGVPKVADRHSSFTVKTPDREIHCLVMEKIIGKNLEEILAERYPQGCPEVLACEWLWQVATILNVLHKRKIVHRDIKPSNLMLRTDRGTFGETQLVLIDFGGAKPIDPNPSSTRLFSSGYSPPEQMSGGGSEPTADIYALGRTIIHLLTGRYPVEMEDIETGQLKWRNYAKVNPRLATLLDNMIHPTADRRLQSARAVKRELATLRSRRNPFAKLTQTWQKIKQRFLPLGLAIAKTIRRTQRISAIAYRKVSFAGLETLREMVWGGMGAIIGILLGQSLITYTIWGDEFADGMNHFIAQLALDVTIKVEPKMLVVAIAGLGTAWGLAEPKSYRQRSHPFFAGIGGFLGYAIAWLFWLGFPDSLQGQFLGFLGISVALLTLGLGLSDYVIIHLMTSVFGTGVFFLGLLEWCNVSLQTIPEVLSFSYFFLTTGVFVLMGMAIAFSLSLSYFIVVPICQWLKRK
ncbi:protein kinase domain-containing protein [Spirulina sp. 06S082]|uniref:protein kinase domain-containing protein n=1 Tax=Spirulina sp. 06S082 TaxID=3110248 RepID=UPI002B206E35|nr:protein kinase [Spirulina sp. 06S082]MEA5469025.1 protein kinase [Spirulina sp. 06S082]